MENYHILTPKEISALYQSRVQLYQELADDFIVSKWGKITQAPRYIKQKLIQFLATNDKYNGTPAIENLLTTPYWHKLPDDQLGRTIDYQIKQLKCNDDILSETISTGTHIRENDPPSYPAIFQGSDRIYIQLPLIKSHPSQIERMIHDFNTCLPSQQALSYRSVTVAETSYYISDNVNDQHIGTFLGRKVRLLEGVETMLATKTTAEKDNISEQIRNRDFYQYSEQNGHPIKVDWLKRDHHIVLDPILYGYFKQHLKTSNSSISQITSIVKENLSQLKNSISFEQDRQGNNEYDALVHDTDLVILSKDPHDIAWCSAYTDYEMFSCMNPIGALHQYVSEDIGRGTLVAYIVNSKQPFKRHSRILLKPYLNKQGDSIYHIGKTHGEKNYAFDRFLRKFACDYLNSPQTDTYTIEPHLYPDSEPQQIVYSRYLENSRC